MLGKALISPAAEVVPDAPIKVIGEAGNMYVVRDHSVEQVDKKGRGKAILSSLPVINDAETMNGEIWVATAQGLQVYDGKSFLLKRTFFEGDKIIAVAKDAEQKIWAATALNGVFRQGGPNGFEQKLDVMVTNAMVCTADSNAYIGTPIGLYKINVATGHVTRFAEEGHSGYELPDNIVERLYKDGRSNVWVVMPDHIAFKSNGRYKGELPSYSFIGDKGNAIRNVIGLEDGSYLFATRKGLALLPSTALQDAHHHHGGMNEVFQEHGARALSLTASQAGAPDGLSGRPVEYVAKQGGDIYFFTADGHWKTKERRLLKMAKPGTGH